jgi:signal transduction histidine kinase
MAVLYTLVVFGLGALVIGSINFAISRSLDAEALTAELQIRRVSSEPGAAVWLDSVSLETVEQLANSEALSQLRNLSFITLIVLLPVSLVAGWYIAGRVLRPVGAIAGVAEEIQASDLSQRIRLVGPDDELKHLADTFDAMLDRVERGVEDQRQFIQDVSHELRNPLATMSMNLDVVLGDEAASEQDFRTTAEVLRRSIDRTARTVDDLMRFARRELPAAGAGHVELGLLAGEVLADLKVPADKRSLELDLVGEEGPKVRADRTAMRSAIANLAGNAVRLAPKGSTVTFGAGAQNGWAWVGISDEGPGIPEPEHQLVFQRNWGRDSSRLHREQRAGLGLSIVRHVAESHGGTVTLSSDPAIGSSFVIWLPLSDGSDPAGLTVDGIHPVEDPLFAQSDPD